MKKTISEGEENSLCQKLVQNERRGEKRREKQATTA